MGKVKRLELWWQKYVTWLLERDVRNIRPFDFCGTACTLQLLVKLWSRFCSLLKNSQQQSHKRLHSIILENYYKRRCATSCSNIVILRVWCWWGVETKLHTYLTSPFHWSTLSLHISPAVSRESNHHPYEDDARWPQAEKGTLCSTCWLKHDSSVGQSTSHSSCWG